MSTKILSWELYREAFDAEMKERAKAVGYSMGLPRPYVDSAVDMHSSLGLMLHRIKTLEASSESANDATALASRSHAERLRDAFCDIARARFQLEVKLKC